MKYRFRFVVAIFTILYIIIIGLVFSFYRQLALKDAKQEAFYVLDTMNAVRDYISIVQRPLIDELKVEGVIKDDFFDPRLQSSSYITREIYNIQLSKNKINYDYKLVATNPLNPEHEGDEFENEILEGFKEKRYEEFSQVIKDGNTSYIYVGLPVKNSQASCAVCHNINSVPKKMMEQYGSSKDFEGKVGDTIAMISFKIPIKNILAYHANELITSSVALFVVFVLLVFLVYKIHEKMAKIKEQNEQLMIHQSRLASMGEMIGNISHQWKQPLAQISSTLINLELYNEKGKLTKEKLNEKIKDVDEQVKFMSQTINDFKNFFNPNSIKREFTSAEAIEQTQKILKSALKNHVIKLDVEIKENFSHFGNINEIIQILINIISNAKEAFGQSHLGEKRVKICSFKNSLSRMITIENNAGNIDKSVIKKIFNPNFTTKEKGSGLGLYMSQVIMKKNNGFITVQNTKDGVIFTILFLNS
ncbi:DUF3365 domain-containing protein [Campylobacter sp. RM9344]|uniref:histidine kinase n=1 Tax=Campylobacter californiensis TaxID=1032243 RepID=A0AAW3ZV12_9BACT|nr:MULTISPECIES: DUF3365 domain-containing protein [unclassified Campylobacter]MBE2983823.1 DUF3365 domain-containing protein [Campylobacter sp. RM6883]MBE2994361.1 DUF3365 domain-containing protein [Campylobacter sp. RM6913]MBE3028669.1 DUF3365 domain-containing protein [Campylobacter sp. RM9344]MBE3607558.1 DUF3365 domain-containing protein [Campylobacter sp. RM9337]QCD50952.1 two-component system sensor histidine kinase (DUF3365 domain) [Campylobacter sp. RM6914]